MLYVKEDLPLKTLSIDKANESCFVDLNLSYSYNPNNRSALAHLTNTSYLDKP